MEKIELAHRFSLLARWSSEKAGTWQAFLIALSIIIAWMLGGFYFGFSSQIYQLFINSVTTVITFLMVFLIQGAQVRDIKVLQLKLDELLHAITKANSNLIDLENATDEQIERARRKVCETKDDPREYDRP